MSKLLKMRRLFSERHASAAFNAPIVGKQSGFVALTRADENYGLDGWRSNLSQRSLMAASKCLDTTGEYR
jgi:hypothetical protein